MKRVLIALLLLALLPCAAFADNPPEINNAELQEMIAKNSGKVIMINFFATWCPPCRAEIPELAKLRASLPESRLLLIGLSVDQNPIVVEPFMKQTGINYPVFMAGQSITDAYGVSSVPHNAFIAPDGKLDISEPGMANEEVLKKVVSDLLK